MLIKHTVTPTDYSKSLPAINTWLSNLHHSGRATISEKQQAEKMYNQLFINKFRQDGK